MPSDFGLKGRLEEKLNTLARRLPERFKGDNRLANRFRPKTIGLRTQPNYPIPCSSDPIQHYTREPKEHLQLA